MVSKWVNDFNNNRTISVAALVVTLLEDTMSAW